MLSRDKITKTCLRMVEEMRLRRLAGKTCPHCLQPVPKRRK